MLYVEDSPQNRDIVRRYLDGMFEIIEAEDGEHGLDRARRDEPDLILMDLSLPRIDGWEATRQLKADPQAGVDSRSSRSPPTPAARSSSGPATPAAAST